MNRQVQIEKFPATELTDLRRDLQQTCMDSRRAADLVSAFLSGRGYGVCDALRSAAIRIDAAVSLQRMQEELEKVAFVM